MAPKDSWSGETTKDHLKRTTLRKEERDKKEVVNNNTGWEASSAAETVSSPKKTEGKAVGWENEEVTMKGSPQVTEWGHESAGWGDQTISNNNTGWGATTESAGWGGPALKRKSSFGSQRSDNGTVSFASLLSNQFREEKPKRLEALIWRP